MVMLRDRWIENRRAAFTDENVRDGMRERGLLAGQQHDTEEHAAEQRLGPVHPTASLA